MFTVFDCIAHEHDPSMVILAGLACLLASITAVLLGDRASSSTGPARSAWIATCATAFAAGVWTTHFLAMLGFSLTAAATFSPSLCILSAIPILIASGAGFWIHARAPRSRSASLVAGMVIAIGIAVMHYTGMAAFHLSATLHFDPHFVVASLLLCGLSTCLAMASLAKGRWRMATALLWLGVCGLHFTGMTAVSVGAWTGAEHVGGGIPRTVLAAATAASGILIMLIGLAGFLVDQHLSRRLGTEARRFRQLADATFEGIVIEQAGTITDVNAAMCALAGAPAGSLIGRKVEDLLCGSRSDGVHMTVPQRECALVCADGTSLPVEVLNRQGETSDALRVIAVRDISERRAKDRQIQRLAHYDTLTGVANRQLFEIQLRQALALASRAGSGVALLCLDLDRFKWVNDTMGHPLGDQLLIRVAQRLLGTVREIDTVARLGGDEFAIIQAMAGEPGQAAEFADRIVTELALPYDIDGHQIVVGASIGIALFPDNGSTVQDLLKNADLAMYRAKQDGRGTWRYFDVGMDLLLEERRKLEHDLREALAHNQFELHYQPLWDGTSLEVTGYEALLRWTHPLRGDVSPSDFIPLAEESSLIVPIGRWVLETACAEAASWDRPLTIAVNLSPCQFRQKDLAAMIGSILRTCGLPPERLELEITEGVLIENTEHALQVLRALKEIGIRIALDDFGTGYSSLSYLRKFPFDKLKIDRSFVQGLGEDPEAESIVQAIIAMSRGLHLDVTAEGVETKAQLMHLQSYGCGALQGFLLGPPRSAPDLRGTEPLFATAEISTPGSVPGNALALS